MAEKPDKKPDEKPAAGGGGGGGGRGPAPKAGEETAKPAKGGLLKSTPILLGIVMVLEAGVLFAGFKFLSIGPVAAKGAELAAEESTPAGGGHGDAHGGSAKTDGHGGSADPKVSPKKLVELKVVEFKAPNKQSGRSYIYDVSIYLSTKGEHKQKVEATITDRDALIKDRIRTIIAQCDPEKLGGAEPELVTLRRQVKSQLEEIIGEGLIEEVLVPRCIQYRTDY